MKSDYLPKEILCFHGQLQINNIDNTEVDDYSFSDLVAHLLMTIVDVITQLYN